MNLFEVDRHIGDSLKLCVQNATANAWGIPRLGETKAEFMERMALPEPKDTWFWEAIGDSLRYCITIPLTILSILSILYYKETWQILVSLSHLI